MPGRKPKLNARQQAHLVTLIGAGEHSSAELADLVGVGRSTVYRVLELSRVAAMMRPADVNLSATGYPDR